MSMHDHYDPTDLGTWASAEPPRHDKIFMCMSGDKAFRALIKKKCAAGTADAAERRAHRDWQEHVAKMRELHTR